MFKNFFEISFFTLECPTTNQTNHIEGVIGLLQSLDDNNKCTQDKITNNGLIGTREYESKCK